MPTLFDHIPKEEPQPQPRPKRTHIAPYQKTDTSKAAAQEVDREGSAQMQRSFILAMTHDAGPVNEDGTKGGMTDWELSKRITQRLGKLIPPSSISARRGEVMDPDKYHGAPWIFDSGKRRLNPETGRRVIVWVHKAWMEKK